MSVYENVAVGVYIKKENYYSNEIKQEKECEEYRKKRGMEEVTKRVFDKTDNITPLFEQMELLGSTQESVIITPITNKWKDTFGNMDGVGLTIVTKRDDILI